MQRDIRGLGWVTHALGRAQFTQLDPRIFPHFCTISHGTQEGSTDMEGRKLVVTDEIEGVELNIRLNLCAISASTFYP